MLAECAQNKKPGEGAELPLLLCGLRGGRKRSPRHRSATHSEKCSWLPSDSFTSQIKGSNSSSPGLLRQRPRRSPLFSGLRRQGLEASPMNSRLSATCSDAPGLALSQALERACCCAAIAREVLLSQRRLSTALPGAWISQCIISLSTHNPGRSLSTTIL